MKVSDRPNAKNHAIFKADFDTAYDEEYEGVRLSMEPDYDQGSTGSNGGRHPSYQTGCLLMKPVRYPGPSRSTARTCLLELTMDSTLSHLLNTIINQDMLSFHFIVLNDRYYGCRDFT